MNSADCKSFLSRQKKIFTTHLAKLLLFIHEEVSLLSFKKKTNTRAELSDGQFLEV